MHIVFALVYAIVGILLAIPYCLLAGWNGDSFVIVAFVAPAFLVPLLVAAIFAGIIGISEQGEIQINWKVAFRKNNRRPVPGSLALFWGWILYSFLPVIFHWSAVLLQMIELEKVSSLIETHRYRSPILALIAILFLFILAAMTTSVIEKTKKVWARVRNR